MRIRRSITIEKLFSLLIILTYMFHLMTLIKSIRNLMKNSMVYMILKIHVSRLVLLVFKDSFAALGRLHVLTSKENFLPIYWNLSLLTQIRLISNLNSMPMIYWTNLVMLQVIIPRMVATSL